MMILGALLLADAVFIAVLLGILAFLKQTKKATYAVLRRNFVSYFSSPTGYVFICVFMLLSSIAAFWPEAFFNENLATLGQLNRWFPLVMLVFIPAITMSVWAEERREGTDELLLTMPASDVDIVLGKYLAAAMIFTVALIMSQLSNFAVLLALSMGELDLGLFLTTYVGYWLMGLAMLSVGMVASFFTSNLTVGFILGALLNAPLAFLQFADWFLPGGRIAQQLSAWSFAARFRDFGRGVISVSSTFFFVAIIVLGIYVSLVLIGRRHWMGGRDGRSMLGHYLVRVLALVVAAMGISVFLTQNDRIRFDATSGRVSSLAPETRKILKSLSADTNLVIETYASGKVPESYTSTVVDLVNKVREFDALTGPNVQVRIHDQVDPYSEVAEQAEEQYGIKPETVMVRDRGKFEDEEFVLGAAISSGVERVVIPFFGNGVPVEYELVRSIKTVTGDKRKRLGVVQTDAQLFGGFDMASMQMRPKERIITELEKQYTVESVDPASPIDENRFDVLLVVQPSSLGQAQLDHVIAAIRNGVPSAVFEDPLPFALSGVPGTGEPKAPKGNPMFGGGMPPEPKGDITRLWSALGIEMVGNPSPNGEGFSAQVVYQDYNPYPKLAVDAITKEWVFVSPQAPGADDETLSTKDVVTSGLQEILCIFPGAIRDLDVRGIELSPLLKTTEKSGYVEPESLKMARGDSRQINRLEKATDKRYLIAARITGRAKDEVSEGSVGASPTAATNPGAGNPAATSTATPPTVKDTGKADGQGVVQGKDAKAREINVIYVSDIDMLASQFLEIRERPDDEIGWRFENVTFVLNTIDSLAGEDDLVSIRKRQPRHSTLKLIDAQTADARDATQKQISGFAQKFDEKVAEIENDVQKEFRESQERFKALEDKRRSGDSSPGLLSELQKEAANLRMIEAVANKRLDVEKAKLQQEQERQIEKINSELERTVKAEQFKYKRMAVIPAFVFPCVIGLGMWLIRSQKEREGITELRRR